MVLGHGPGSVRYTTRASRVVELVTMTSPTPGESLVDGDDAGPHLFSLKHFALPNGRAFATLPHQCAAQRPA